MQFSAKLRYVRFSPYKLRPLADVIRGKDAQSAISWLSTYAVKRARPLKKMIQSAVANAYNLNNNMQVENLIIADLRVDEGPMYRYYKPGAMGRATVLRKRFSHVSVVLRPKKIKSDKIEKA